MRNFHRAGIKYGAIIPTLAGPEIGVASTKAFTCQLTALACVAIVAGKARGVIDEALEAELAQALAGVPRHMATVLRDEKPYETLAHRLQRARDVLYLGRGQSYPIALEGALKLKEISYIHAEGYAAGELKHGSIALIDENMPVIVIAPRDDLFEKTMSNMQEVAARRRPDRADQRRRCGKRGLRRPLSFGRAAAAPLRDAPGLRPSGSAYRLPHGGVHGHRRRSAQKPGKIRDGGIGCGPRICLISLFEQGNQRDLTRAIKAAVAAGMVVERAWIEVDGRIMLGFKTDVPDQSDQNEPNPWDEATAA